MTALDTRPETETTLPTESAPLDAADRTEETVAGSASPPPTPGRIILLVLAWLVVTILSMMLVLYGLEPLFQERTQSQMLDRYRLEVEHASNETGGLGGVTVPTLAPELGAAVGIVEIGRLQLQQVVVEGALPLQTQAGPGHVPGTAGPGQPGNSAIVGRRGTFGAPFRNLGQLEIDDPILITTTQGQAVYKVVSVQQQRILPAAIDASAGAATETTTTTVDSPTTTTSSDPSASTTTTAAPTAIVERGAISLDELYASTADDRLTLVTSADKSPRNAEVATVVVAQLQGLPFPPTPQGGRTASQSGLQGDSGAMAPFLLALSGFVLAAGAAVVLYRRSTVRIAYLLTTPPLIAFIILAAEAFSRFFPAWM